MKQLGPVHASRFAGTRVTCREMEMCLPWVGLTLGPGPAEPFMSNEHAQREMCDFASDHVSLPGRRATSKLKGSVHRKGCVFVTREKRQSNKKIIKVTTCEKLKRFPLSFLNL